MNGDLIANVIRFLQLQKPYAITLKPKLKDAAAVYYSVYRKNKLVKHLIEISVENLPYDMRDLNTLIAHELIHAWQTEFTDEQKMHGPEFRKMAKLVSAEFDLPLIYIKGTDLDN